MSNHTLLSSGPFQVPVLTTISTSTPNPPSPNERIVISISNPTNRVLEAKVEINISQNPNTSTTGPINLDTLGEFAIGTSGETENSIFVQVNPKSTTRIERLIDPSEVRGTFRVFTSGDFALIDSQPAGGGLEISVVVGNQVDLTSFGLDEGDASTFIPYGSFFVV